jgi:hypothetical protein
LSNKDLFCIAIQKEGTKSNNSNRTYGSNFLRICKILNRLNAIAELYQEELLNSKQVNNLTEMINMKEKTVNDEGAEKLAQERLGEFWELLSTRKKERMTKAISICEQFIPEGEKAKFAQGLTAGVVLRDAAYILKKHAKRQFDPGNGLHLTGLRGEFLTKEFQRAHCLAENYNKGKFGEDQITPLPHGSLIYLKAMEQASLTTPFNNGLVCGFDLK